MVSNRIGRVEFLFWCSAPIIVGSVVIAIVALSLGAMDVNAPSGDPKLRGLLAPAVLFASE